MNVNVDYASISDKIEITEDDKIVNAKDEEINTEDIKYKSTKVNKNNVLDILGEDGKLQILNANNDVLLEVNKDTQANEDGIIEANFENEIDSIKVKMTKPTKIGTIKIENTKEIKETYLNLDDNTIKTQTNVKAINDIQKTEVDNTTTNETEEKEIYSFSNDYITKIEDSQTKVDLSVDKQNWTNNTVNDVNFTLKLISNDVKYNLFKNPVIEMKLPEDVDKVILGNTSLLNNDSNFSQNTEVVDNGTNKVIRVTLSGTQNNYYADSIYEGTYVVIPAKITLKGDLTANDSNIEVTYSNENGKVLDYVAEGNENKKINIKELDEKQDTRLSAARYQIQTNDQNTEESKKQEGTQNSENTTQQIQGINYSVETRVGNKVLKEGDTIYEKQIVTYRIKVQNDSQKEVNNLKIVGKIPDGTTLVTVSKGEDDAENMEKMYEYVGDSSVKEKELEIATLAAGETEEREYDVEVNQLAEDTTEANISSSTTLYVNGKESGEITLNNIAKKSTVYARMVSTMGGLENEDNKWEYYLLITNKGEQELKDVDVSINIPRWMEVINYLLSKKWY